MKRCLFLIVVLATIPSTFALPPGEFPLAPLPFGAAPHERRRPEVAASNRGFLVVWEDARVNPNQPRLWAARVSQTGVLLDPSGISIAAFAEGSLIGTHVRSVASDGTDWLVAWSDDADHLQLAKVTAEGQVIRVADPQLGGDGGLLLWTGTIYAAFLTDKPTVPFIGTGVGVAALDRDGRVLVRSGLPIQSVRSISAVMNRDRTTIYFGWLEVASGAVHIAQIAPGQIETGSIFIAPAGFDSPVGTPTNLSIATDGINILATWVDESLTPNVYKARLLDPNGSPLTPVITLGPASVFTMRAGVTWNGMEFLVAMKDINELARLQRIAQDGTVLGAPIIVSGPVTEITIASLPGIDDSILVWNDVQGPVQEINANMISPASNQVRLPNALLLSASFADRSDATVAWRGDHYLGVWRDALDATRVSYGRFTVDGVPLDGTGVQIGSGSQTVVPAMASDGHTAVAAWIDLTGVTASFIDAAGRQSRLAYGFPGSEPSVVWNGQQYLIAWRSNQGRLLALRVSASGQIIDNSPIDVAGIPNRPFIAWTGNSYVVVYQQFVTCGPPCEPFATLFAQFVSPSLTPIGSALQVSDPFAFGDPVVGGGPAGALIVWARKSGTTTLRGARAINGALLDSVGGFEIGAASYATIYGSAAGWGVVSGPSLWTVSRSGGVGPRLTAFPFVPAGARSTVVLGGPEPLVVYRREPVGSEQMMQVVARYAFTPGRSRAAKH